MGPTRLIIKDILNVAADYLKQRGIESPRLTAEILLARQLNHDRLKLYLNFDQPLTEDEISAYRSRIRRRVRREPLQYITGVQEFWSLEFLVDRRVLIPRPETELLVQEAIGLATLPPGSEDRVIRILDLGTGCGAIAVCLAREIPHAQISATDISRGALKVASINATSHGVLNRISFLQGDLWGPFIGMDISFDIILSNPPYVASGQYDSLPPEVRDYEPRQALDGRENGMHYIKAIIETAPDFLNPGGWLILEMSPEQTQEAIELIDRIKGYGKSLRKKDYSHVYRLVMAQRA